MYFALSATDDVNHRRAVALAKSEYRQLCSTNFVVAETHALVLRRLGWQAAIRFLETVDGGATEVIRVRAADERRAREIIFAHTDKDYSYTDAASFAVMEREGIRVALSFDRHFAQFGFITPGLDHG
jgi:uncharacterized protein